MDMDEVISPDINNTEANVVHNQPKSKVSQDQIHDILFGNSLSWQAIIYDLINTEQLNPWDVDITLLSNKYLEKVKLLEEANFVVSSKVLLAAAILLRMKSEILLDYDLPTIDQMLFGKKEEKKYTQERIELDEEIPALLVKTPIPRFKKVTLEELMKALGKAINTENRRIKKIVAAKQQEYETSLYLPKSKINVKDRIRQIYSRLKTIFENREEKLAFSEFAGKTDDERITAFVPLLHLDNQNKVWLEQEAAFDEIFIWLKNIYERKNSAMLEKMRKEVEEELSKIATEEEIAEVENEFEHPLDEQFERKIQSDVDDMSEEE